MTDEAARMRLPGKGILAWGEAQQGSERLVHDKRERGPVGKAMPYAHCRDAVPSAVYSMPAPIPITH